MSAATGTMPSAASRPGDRQPVLAIARTECARLLRHPAFLAGLTVSAVLALMTGPLNRGAEAWAGERYYSATTAWMFVWVGTIVAAGSVAGRERLTADTELFPAVPVRPSARVLGTALGLVGPAAATAAVVAAVAAAALSNDGFVHGGGAYARRVVPHVFEWVQPVLLVVVAGVVGIAIAQLRRARMPILLAAALLTFFAGSIVWVFQVHPVRVLHPFMFPAYEVELPASSAAIAPGATDALRLPPDETITVWRETRFDPGALGWHLVYLLGLTALGVAMAARMADRSDGSRPPRRGIAAVGAALVAVGGVAQVATAGMPG